MATSPEFDSPPSAAVPAERSRYSIDLSLELEHQLNMDSQPSTPSHPPPQPEPPRHRPGGSSGFQMPDIDPHVLAHIISELRQQLTGMTRERDDLLALIATSATREAELQDALQHITDKAMALDEALSETKRKNKDDEEAISLLRTKVEESRRGLMRLQAERRQPSMALDTSRANTTAFTMSPPSSKRASFTPLTGTFAGNSFRPNAHRRISSVSDSNVSLEITAPSPNQSLTFASPSANRRSSGFFGRASPPRDVGPHISRTSSSSSHDHEELEKLRNELKTAQSALQETRHELGEAIEAREASENCAAALRDFIAANGVGANLDAEVKLPPLPAATTGDESGLDQPRKDKGWGFKLWKGDGTAAPRPDVTGSPIVSSAALPSTGAAPGPAPLSRKLTGFFSSRSSVSSGPPGNGPPPGQRTSVYSFSDASSLAEPISPTNPVFGLPVQVRDGDAGLPDPSSPEDIKAAISSDAASVLSQ
ncbi:unnamed protein product [Mycena citricolor]|uniref:Uncharacterized protein n=1 Tax=Mycena citricolor TaxID=2018698 RepID=A0AAD2H1Y9_9AGAR|nr:unnamed protein product [Mycena citricolor]